MTENKFITLEGLIRFKELLDDSYSARFVAKNQSAGEEIPADETLPDGENFASDEEVANLLDDIFG